MDRDNPPVTSTRPPPLTSDQLNYLIWRYLQEAGYADAAVRLQRDWNLEAETLPFARRIKPSALVNLVQKGLRYHHLSLRIDEQGHPTREPDPSLFFFGPESEKPPQEIREITRPSSSHAPAASPESAIPAKREIGLNGVHDTTPQPAPKKSRKPAGPASDRNGPVSRKTQPTSTTLVTNIELNAPNGLSSHDGRSPSVTEPPGLEDIAAAINGVHGDDRMDVDTDGEQLIETPLEPVLLHTLVNGESRGVQVEPAKVADLNPHCTILGLDRTVLSQVLWHPANPSFLAARADTLCGVWQTSSFNQSLTEFQDLIRFQSSDENCVTAIAWAPSGHALAVAVSTPAGGEIHLYDGKDLGLLETLGASQRIITRLQWQKDGTRLVGLAPANDGNSESSIMLWDLSGVAPAGPHSVTVPETLEDIDCDSFENQALICASGGRAVYHLRAYPELEVEQKWTSSASDSENWAFAKCAFHNSGEPLVVAASNESGRVWLPARDLIHEAHHGPITALQVRPHLAHGRHTSSALEFATCSVDGTIKAWSYNGLHNNLTVLCKLTIGYGQPLKIMAYSPDGFCLAGTGYSDVRVWNAEHRYNLMASWQGLPAEWSGNAIKDRDMIDEIEPQINGDMAPYEHSLSWDADSMKMAFSLGSQVAIINFQR